jgi:hypothetical protein
MTNNTEFNLGKRIGYEPWTDYVVRQLRQFGHIIPNLYEVEPVSYKGGTPDSFYNGLRTDLALAIVHTGGSVVVRRSLLHDIGYSASVREEFAFSSAEKIDAWVHTYKHISQAVGSCTAIPFLQGKEQEIIPSSVFCADLTKYLLRQGILGWWDVGKERQEEKAKVDLQRRASLADIVASTHRQLSEISSHVRDMKRTLETSGDRMLLLSDGDYLTRLYTAAIQRNADNLRFAECEGEKIPYVLVHSDEIEANVGRVYHNLYFVARDKAPEPWQQQLVAYHESLCAKIGHENARKREKILAEKIGKAQEHQDYLKANGADNLTEQKPI